MNEEEYRLMEEAWNRIDPKKPGSENAYKRICIHLYEKYGTALDFGKPVARKAGVLLVRTEDNLFCAFNEQGKMFYVSTELDLALQRIADLHMYLIPMNSYKAAKMRDAWRVAGYNAEDNL